MDHNNSDSDQIFESQPQTENHSEFVTQDAERILSKSSGRAGRIAGFVAIFVAFAGLGYYMFGGSAEQIEVADTKEQIAEQIASEPQLAPRPENEQFFFAYDSSLLTDAAKAELISWSQFLKDHKNLIIQVEGHCDERGSRAYNMELGERRAQATKNFLVAQGIEAKRIKTISFGEDRPVAKGNGELNWSQNRRSLIQAVTTLSQN